MKKILTVILSVLLITIFAVTVSATFEHDGQEYEFQVRFLDSTGEPLLVDYTNETRYEMPDTPPTRYGYTFKGWKNTYNGDFFNASAGYVSWDGIYDTDAREGYVEFEPVWSSDPWIITFMGDGVHRYTKEVKKGSSFNLPDYTHCEYDILLLKGWLNTATGVTYEVGSTVSPSSNVTYKAVWELMVIFSGDSFYPFSMSASVDGTFIMPNLPTGVSREGYAFGGWTAGGKLYQPFEEVNLLDLGYCDFVAYWIYTGEGIGGGSSGGSSGDSGMGSDTEYNFITKFFSDTFNMTKELCMPYLTSFEIPFLGITLYEMIRFVYFGLISFVVIFLVSKVLGAIL